MNYFDRSISLPPLPNNVWVESLDLLVNLLITTKENFDSVSKPEHFEKAKIIIDIFIRFNIVRP